MSYLEIEDVKKDWNKATKGLAKWRSETRESYDFAASHQWTDQDIARLEEEERPAVTFDRIGVFIDAVCGMEVNNRQEITYLPIEQGDVHVADTLSKAVKFYENDCGAEDEDSEAVRDAVICGVGVTETVMSMDKNPDGAPTVFRRDPLQTWFDPDSSRRNLFDARFIFYGDWISLEEAQSRWPDASFSSQLPGNIGPSQPHLADRAFEYKENATEDDHEGQVFILHYQCWKREDVYRLRDESGNVTDFTKTQFTAAKKLFNAKFGRDPVEATSKNPSGDYLKTTKKCFYRAFVSGSEILEDDKLKVDDFTFKFITYKRDRNSRSWYGLVRTMKDPQRWANKWLSQILHIVNTNAKGGAFAEEGAFRDPRNAENQWAQPNPLILLKEGGIDKIKERGQAQYPSGLDKLMQFAFNALPMVSGLNLEILGLADRDQAGVLESQRKQSAYQILAPLFSAIREYRKARGKLLLGFLKYVPPGTLIRITGPSGEQWVPFIFKDTKYDVRVDQAPDSPDFKQKTWESLQVILPAMMKAGYPIPPEILEYSPLPPDISEQWVQWIKNQGWMPPEQQKQIQMLQEQMQATVQENQGLKEENINLKLDRSMELAKLQLKQEESDHKNSVKIYQSQIEAQTQRMDALIQNHRDQLNAVNQERQSMIENALAARQQLVDEQLRLHEQHSKDRIEESKARLKAVETLLKAQSEKKLSMNVKRIGDGVYEMTPK